MADDEIYLRKLPPEIATEFKSSAGARNMTHSQYGEALVRLHMGLREIFDKHKQQPDRANDDIRRLMKELKLEGKLR